LLGAEDAFNSPPDKLSAKLKIYLKTGLTEQEAARILRIIGPKIFQKSKRALMPVIVDNFKNILIPH
jgi:hypothetical protein